MLLTIPTWRCLFVCTIRTGKPVDASDGGLHASQKLQGENLRVNTAILMVAAVVLLGRGCSDSPTIPLSWI